MLLPADVASNWLACFPFSAQKYVYDVFFVRGFITEVLQILVPSLQQNRSDDLDINVVISNSERYDMSVHIVLSLKLSFICLYLVFTLMLIINMHALNMLRFDCPN